MTDTSRRGLLKMMGTAVPLAAGWKVNNASAETAHQAAAREATKAAALGKAYTPKFFTAHEWQTVRALCDLVASGFWSSKMGVEDLDYRGNVFVAEWKGPPKEVLEKLGLPTE